MTGEERIAGLVTGAGYPDALGPVLEVFAGLPGLICDVGAGLGAATWWLAGQGAVDVMGVEPEPSTAALARRVHPDLPMAAGVATALPLRAGQCDGVAALGVVSLLDDLDGLLDEVRRVLGSDGRVAITDLCAVGGAVLRPPSTVNVFRPLDVLTSALGEHGFDVVRVWRAPADLSTRWDAVGDMVDDEIERRHGGSAAYAAWREDRDRLGGLIGDGALELGTVTAAVHRD